MALMDDKKTDQAGAAFIFKFWLLILGIATCIILPVVALGIYLDDRLDTIDAELDLREADHPDRVGMEIADLPEEFAQGQTIYVPAYSHVYHGSDEPQLLTINLVVRNTSAEREIFLSAVNYHDTKGKMVKSYLDRPLRLLPLATAEFVVSREDTSGGIGASFLVDWLAKDYDTDPLVESVMVDTTNKQGISFVRRGIPIREKRRKTSESGGESEE